MSIYTATPRLPVGLLREIFQRAGVHLYQNRPGMTGVAGNYLIVHTAGAMRDETIDEILDEMEGERVFSFSWPGPIKAITRIVPYRDWPLVIEKDGRTWNDTLPGKTTAIYLVE
ncbi:MAG: hypothetical protein QG656_104 [Candidatus Hydrogenedentes bacterium]|nr:hypothetical protein [Candidatus Hydrogenedentota bacterium]